MLPNLDNLWFLNNINEKFTRISCKLALCLRYNNCFMTKKIIQSLIALLFVISSFSAQAQFYNGHQMGFGKNRVQYNNFFWNFYRFPRFDIYFYEEGRPLARYASHLIEERIIAMENKLGYTLDRRIIFLTYNKLTDFRQSNIGLISGSDETNVGGVTQLIDNKVFLYYEGDIEAFKQQIDAAIAEVVLTYMMFGAKVGQKFANSALLYVPDWYFQGLIAYLSKPEDPHFEQKIKDGILSSKYKKIDHLHDEEAKLAGESIWRFIENAYGRDVIPNIVYLTRVNRSVDEGLESVLGMSMKQITPLWLDYYKLKYLDFQDKSDTLQLANRLVKRPKKTLRYMRPKFSPDGKQLAYITNEKGKYNIYLYNSETQETKRIEKNGQKLEQLTDYSFPVINWHPTGKQLAYITEEKGMLFLNLYFTETQKTVQRRLLYFDKVRDFNFSEKGFKIVMSAVMKGRSDIFVFDVASGTHERITNDLYNDIEPRFTSNNDAIVFASQRVSDTILAQTDEFYETQPFYDLYVYDYKNKTSVLQRITDTRFVNETQPQEISPNTYLHISDKNGIYNRQLALYDSTISFIDTVTHYRYFTTQKTITNNPTDFLFTDYTNANKSEVSVFEYKKREYLVTNELDFKKRTNPKTSGRIKFEKNMLLQDSLQKRRAILLKKQQAYFDSLAIVQQKNYVHPDTIPVDIANYLFEKDKYPHMFAKMDTAKNDLETKKFEYPNQRNYLTTFYINELVNQVDLGFLNSSYQAFTGSAFYFNPGFNYFTKIGANDMFEDYRLTAGFRFAGDFNSSEYILSLEDLKNQWDKQYIFHKQTFSNTFEDDNGFPYFTKVNSYVLMYRLKFPVNQVYSWQNTFTGRLDRNHLKATDYGSLLQPSTQRAFIGYKTELIFDNTFADGLNIYNGTRYKFFGEAYLQFDKDYSDLYVTGFDIRHYQKIHRSFIWATRLAGSASFGKSKLIYYLGGVDNWMNVTPMETPTFDQSIRIDPEANYVFQAVATNMRGFSQNIRNGTNFAVLNSEIRWPFVRYFANRPLSTDFFNNLQVVGFADIGTAWSGVSPLSADNAYNTDILENGPVRLIIDHERPPYVWGFGFGVRSKLLGYFVRADWAWGVEADVLLPRVFYLSMNLDF